MPTVLTLDQITPGKTYERKTWKEQWGKGAASVGGTAIALPVAPGCGYIVRLLDQAVLTVVWPQANVQPGG